MFVKTKSGELLNVKNVLMIGINGLRVLAMPAPNLNIVLFQGENEAQRDEYFKNLMEKLDVH